MGFNIVYLPVYYHRLKKVQAGYPFIFNSKREIIELKPDSATVRSMTFTRKYPLTYSKTQWTRNLVGCVIERSNDPDFRLCDTVIRIDKPSPNLHYVRVPLTDDIPYRYWRMSKNGRMINLGEMEFFDRNGEKITGRTINDSYDELAENAFDGNVLTYCHSRSWIGMDFGKPVSVSAVRYISRTDGNGIFAGHEYELLYHGSHGWESFDIVEADQDSITFHNIPGGALYWLRNLTEGVEECILTHKNGKNYFW